MGSCPDLGGAGHCNLRRPDGRWGGRRIPALAAPVGISLSIPLLFYGVFGFLNTEVSEAGIRMSWGPLGFIKKIHPFGVDHEG